MIERLKRLASISFDVSWVAVLVLLPITSLPLLSRLAGNTAVAPAAFIPLCWLALFWFVPYLIKKGTMPRESLPFLFFVSVAIIASAGAFFIAIPPFKNESILGAEISAVPTLMIGAAFYLVTATWLSRSRSRLVFTLKWINVSGLLVILWAAVQAVYVYLFQSNYPDLLVNFQRLISTRDLFIGRITSFAFEPSWLAHEMNLVYMPFWLGATLSGISAFRLRLWKFSLENILLLIGVVIVFISSRVGALALLLVLAFVGIYFNVALVRHVYRWGMAQFSRFPAIARQISRLLLPLILSLALIGIYALGAVGVVYGLSHVDQRLTRLFNIAQLKAFLGNPYLFFNFLLFSERYVYWVAGWNVFNLHPFIGVGLGNAGFYFQKQLPAYSWALPEVMEIYFRATSLPNIKSFWVRLLAETGITGFASFLAWFYVMMRSGWSLLKKSSSLMKAIGWSGLFVLIAFVIEGFSIDTFALPYLWVSLGIVSAARALSRNSQTKAGDELQNEAKASDDPPMSN